MNLIPSKLFSFSDACLRRKELSSLKKRVVLTNGCFDLLHVGHVFALENAKKHGDSLWIAMNSDKSVKMLKGSSRPIFNETVRAYLLSALAAVDGIFIFDTFRLNVEIENFRPDIYVKSGDYTLEKLDVLERQALEKVGAETKFVPFLPGFSTTSILKDITN